MNAFMFWVWKSPAIGEHHRNSSLCSRAYPFFMPFVADSIRDWNSISLRYVAKASPSFHTPWEDAHLYYISFPGLISTAQELASLSWSCIDLIVSF